MRRPRVAPIVVILFAGCVSTPRMPEPSAAHPASASAAESPLPARSGTLAIPGGGSSGPASRVAAPAIPAMPAFGRCADDGAISDAVRGILAEPLTEEGAVRIAVLNNREIRAAYEELGIARADLIQAGLFRNPVFEGNVKFFGGASEIELGIAQSFLDAFYIPMRRRVAACDLAAVKATVARRMVALTFDVRRAFVEQRAAGMFVALRQRALEVSTGSLDLMRQLHDAGNATELQLAAVEEPAAHARLELGAAEAAAAESREPLNVLLGLWGESTRWTAAPGSLEDGVAISADLARCESQCVAASFDLAESRAHAEAAARRAGLASWEGLFSNGEAGLVAKKEVSGDWGVGPGVRVDVPVFDQGCARVAGASAELRRDLARYVSLAVEVRSAARVFRERALALEERAAYLEKVHMPVQDRLLRETLKSFNAMQIGAFEVLVARGRQIDGEREHLQTLEELAVARLDLAELLAGSLDRERMRNPAHPVHEGKADAMAPMGGHR